MKLSQCAPSHTLLPLLRDHTHAHIYAHICTGAPLRTLVKSIEKCGLQRIFCVANEISTSRAEIVPQAAAHTFSSSCYFLFFSFLFAVVFAGPKRKTKIKHALTHTHESKAKLSAIELNFRCAISLFLFSPFSFRNSFSFYTLCIL